MDTASRRESVEASTPAFPARENCRSPGTPVPAHLDRRLRSGEQGRCPITERAIELTVRHVAEDADRVVVAGSLAPSPGDRRNNDLAWALSGLVKATTPESDPPLPLPSRLSSASRVLASRYSFSDGSRGVGAPIFGPRPRSRSVAPLRLCSTWLLSEPSSSRGCRRFVVRAACAGSASKPPDWRG